MGGIKNKLNNKLSNKTLFKVPLWLKGDVRRKSDRGIISDTNPLGSQLPSFSQPSKMLTRNISSTRKSTRWSLYASKTIGSLRLVSSKTIGSLRLVSLTKYLAISCFTLAILSTLILNIISSYSLTNTTSKAEEVSNANTDPSAISLSFSNATGSCSDTSNPANVCMEIPDGGGIATGGHTVTVNAPSNSDYRLTLSSANNETDLVNGANRIRSISNPASISTLNDLADKTWGMSIAASGSVATSSIYGLQSIDNPLVLIDTQSGDGVINNGPAIDMQYGAKVADPSLMPAGDYSVSVVYTATAIVPPAMLTNLVLNDTLLTGQQKEFAVQGTNLSSTTSVKLCKADSTCYVADKVMTYPGTAEAETIISFVTPAVNEVGNYDVVVETAGGEARLNNSLRVVEQSICRNGDANSDCQVDIDANMIPVYYDGNNADGSAIWKTLSSSDISNNPGKWYDYSQKQWANAVTVASSSLNKYKNKSGVVVDNNNVMGYWVYIPRYAYEVQRPNAVDRVVADEVPLPDNMVNDTWETNSHAIKNDFIIHFEKSTNGIKTPAATCNNLNPTKAQMWRNGTPVENAGMFDSSILAKDYRTACVNERGISRDYTASSSSGTTWATHPAFAWGSMQMNGFWVGKFEATGIESQLTIKPNQASLTGSSSNPGGTIGEVYTAAKGVGQYDSNNNGGSPVSGLRQNSHNLSLYKSHMIKNSEWGATAYLSASYYGAGVGNIARNTVDSIYNVSSSGVKSRTVTGCGANLDTNSFYTRDGTRLTQSVTQSLTACSQDVRMAYNGEFGKLASTTNNVYGVYDMNAGGTDMVAANASYSVSRSSTYSSELMSVEAESPYVDLYLNSSIVNRPDWSAYPDVDDGSGIPFSRTFGSDTCTWESCGGDALHETLVVQSVGKSAMYSDAAWGGLAGASFFEKVDPSWDYGSVDNDHSWMNRGGNVTGAATPWSYSADSGGSGRDYMGGATTHVVLFAQ